MGEGTSVNDLAPCLALSQPWCGECQSLSAGRGWEKGLGDNTHRHSPSWTLVTEFVLGLINKCVYGVSILDFQNLRYGASFHHLSSVTAGDWSHWERFINKHRYFVAKKPLNLFLKNGSIYVLLWIYPDTFLIPKLLSQTSLPFGELSLWASIYVSPWTRVLCYIS